MAKKAYIGVPSYTIIIERTMTYSSDGEWSWGLNTSNEVNWTKGNTYVCNVEIDGVVYPNLTFAPDVGASWFATYSENGEEVFGVYVSANNQLYDYKLGLDTAVSHTIRLSSGSLDGVARKIKKGFIGIDNKARKIKKAYIGIGGVARPCWSGGEVTYYGELPNGLQQPVAYLAASSNEKYALFGCGEYEVSSENINQYTQVTAYDISLTRFTPTNGLRASYSVGARNGNKALFAGGYSYFVEGYINDVIAYDSNLTKTSGTMPLSMGGMPAATATNNTIIFPDTNKQGVCVTNSLTCTSFNPNITMVGSTATTFQGQAIAAAEDANGYKVLAVTDSGTYTRLDNLTTPRMDAATTTVGDYLIVGGGQKWGDDGYAMNVEVYDKNFTKLTITSVTISVGRCFLQGVSLEDYAILGCGSSGNPITTTDVIDSNLTRTSNLSMSTAVIHYGATTLENYAFFGGGMKNTNYHRGITNVQVFAVL